MEMKINLDWLSNQTISFPKMPDYSPQTNQSVIIDISKLKTPQGPKRKNLLSFISHSGKEMLKSSSPVAQLHNLDIKAPEISLERDDIDSNNNSELNSQTDVYKCNAFLEIPKCSNEDLQK